MSYLLPDSVDLLTFGDSCKSQHTFNTIHLCIFLIPQWKLREYLCSKWKCCRIQWWRICLWNILCAAYNDSLWETYCYSFMFGVEKRSAGVQRRNYVGERAIWPLSWRHIFCCWLVVKSLDRCIPMGSWMEATIKLSKTCCLYLQRPLWSTQEAPFLFYNVELHPAVPHKCFYSHSYQIFMFLKSVCVLLFFSV